MVASLSDCLLAESINFPLTVAVFCADAEAQNNTIANNV
jgi:hypothetical protein